MRSLSATISVFTGLVAVAIAGGELPLTPVATYPPVRPTPKPYVPTGAPIGQRPGHPGTPTAPSEGRPSVFVLTQVPAKPTHLGTPTSPEKCSQVAARITPKLTPRPTYPAALKSMADKLGGIDRDTCGEMDFRVRFKSAKSEELNRFNQARHSTFIMPIWAMVAELWAACGDETRKIPQVAQEPCYRWALELSKSSNASFGGTNSGKNGFEKVGLPGSANRTPEQEASAAAQRGISQVTAAWAVGVFMVLWVVMLA